MNELKNNSIPNRAPRAGTSHSAMGRVRPRAGSDVIGTLRQPVAPAKEASEAKPASTNFPAGSIDSIRQPKPSPRVRAAIVSKPALPRTTKSFVLKRQINQNAKKQRKRTWRLRLRHLVIFVIALIFLGAVGVTAWSFQELLPFKLAIFDRGQSKEATTPSVTVQTSTLDESPVGAAEIAAHRMAADEPRVLSIPKLSLTARVMRVGVSLTGEPIATTNIFDVGWFEASGKPGSLDAVLLNGHAVGPTKQGVFANIGQLQPGDNIVLERGDHTTVTYIVSKVQEYTGAHIDMNAAVLPIDPTKRGLNLMTTTSRYSSMTDQPTKRVIVFALEK